MARQRVAGGEARVRQPRTCDAVILAQKSAPRRFWRDGTTQQTNGRFAFARPDFPAGFMRRIVANCAQARAAIAAARVPTLGTSPAMECLVREAGPRMTRAIQAKSLALSADRASTPGTTDFQQKPGKSRRLGLPRDTSSYYGLGAF